MKGVYKDGQDKAENIALCVEYLHIRGNHQKNRKKIKTKVLAHSS
jgi:hypothetical protein